MTRVFAMFLSLLVVWPATAAAQSPTSCMRPGEDVLAEGPQAVVLELERGARHRWTVCDPATGHRQLLERQVNRMFGSGTWYADFAVAGPYVAFGRDHGNRYDSYGSVGVLDVRAPLPDDPTGAHVPNDGYFRGVVTDVAVNADGRLAYLTRFGAYVVDRAGTRHQVDEARRKGRLRRIAIVGDRVTWRHRGEPRSAPLDPPPPPEGV